MALRGLPGGSYKPISPQEIEIIHRSSMKIFEEVGVEVHEPLALKFFAEAGAEVDYKRKRFYASENWLMDKIKKAPSQVILCGREEKNDLHLGGTNVYLGTGGTALNILDLESGARRPTLLSDVRNTAKLVDALDHVHFFVLPVYPSELRQENVDVNRFFAGLNNTSKHVMGGVYTLEGIRKVIKMGEAIMGGREALRKRPILSMITCIMSPLKMDAKYTELMLEVIQAGIPLATPAAPIAGMTSPITLAGTLVQLNVEALSGILLTQIVNPGTPVLFSYVPTTADMRTMAFLFGAVENGIMNAVGAQLAQFYNLPIYATAGVTEAKIPDVQSGYEKMSTSMLVALAGANYIHDAAGLLESGMTVAYEQYVIDDEINGMVMRALRGIEVNEDSLAVDVIKAVGTGGNFLVQPHTVNHIRSEFYLPQVADRNNRTNWEADGALDGRTKARKIAESILKNHEPLSIDKEVVRSLKLDIPELITEY
ncbi:MAG: trimethylamine methyltransferase family protein [Bacillota bacterium]